MLSTIFHGMRTTYTEEELREAVRSSHSIAQVCRMLRIKVAGGNFETLKRKFVQWDIDVSHFRGKGWNVGLKFKPNPKVPLEQILVENSFYQPYKLKRRLLKSNLLSAMCTRCKGTTWLGQPIPLELHHVNGECRDNRLQNLKLLCPNCHALTENYRGKNIGLPGRKLPE